jgi:hypothetical protein
VEYELLLEKLQGMIGQVEIDRPTGSDQHQFRWRAAPIGPGGRRKKLRTIWLAEEVGSTDTAVAELKVVLGHVFESPKPTGLVRRILQTMPADSVVLDFFAGSGTTGHAVALQNVADGGTRRCISVNSAERRRGGLQRRPRRLRDRRRHHAGPAAGRRGDTLAGSGLGGHRATRLEEEESALCAGAAPAASARQTARC